MDERTDYVDRFSTLLERFARVVEDISPEQMDERLVQGGSSTAVIVSHVLGSLSGSVLGIACGRDVYRNRDEEFQVTGVTPAHLAARLRGLSAEIVDVLGAAEAPSLDETVTPSQELLGLQPVREMQRREALTGALAHAAEHLGELQLVRDLLGQRPSSRTGRAGG